MEKYLNEYLIKSKDKLEDFDNGTRRNVVEWEDGWCEYKIEKDTFNILTIFSIGDARKRFKYIYNMSKDLNCSKIKFTTQRDYKLWFKLLNKLGYTANITHIEMEIL